MERMVQKFSIVFISSGEKTEVFRSDDDVPTEVRQRLARLARSTQVDTLIIANEKGRELLQATGWPRQRERPHPTLSRGVRVGILCALGASVGLLLTWVLQFR